MVGASANIVPAPKQRQSPPLVAVYNGARPANALEPGRPCIYHADTMSVIVPAHTAKTPINATQEFTMDLSGKRIVITGAAGGLGRAVTATVIAQGGTPLLVDLAFPADFAPGEEKFAFDLTDTAATVREVARMGHIDGLMNLAGGFHMGPSHDI